MFFNIITDAVLRGWENFTARPEGPMNFRFILQPLIVSVFAIRAGIKDAKAGRPAYLWSAFTNATHRKELLRSGWKDTQLPFFIAITLDAVYQLIIHRSIFPLELLFTAILLAIIPYLILRGPVSRIAKIFFGAKKPTNN